MTTSGMNNIETLVGQENFTGMQAKVFLFFTPSNAYPSRKGEQPLFAAAKEGVAGITSLSSGGRINAHEQGVEGTGFFTQSSFGVPEGAIFKLFAMKRQSGQSRVASVFLRSRSDAALIRLEVNLTGYRYATMQRAFVEGRFDILSLKQAEELGVRVSPVHRQQFKSDRVTLMMRKTELSPEKRAAPTATKQTVVNSEGREVEVKTRTRKRRLDL